MRQESCSHFQNGRGNIYSKLNKTNFLTALILPEHFLNHVLQQHFTSFCLTGKNFYVVIVMFTALQLLTQANNMQPPPQRVIRLLNQSAPACLSRAVTGGCVACGATLPSPVTEQHLKEWLEIIKPYNVRRWEES